MIRYLAVTIALLLSVTPGAAHAQEAEAIGSIDQLAGFIRWGGVVTSAFVVTGAWMLLRVVGGFVTGFSAQFSVRRLFLKKLQTIVQFVVFIATTIAVIALSFQIDATVLALIGGSVAVAVGFAVKDLVASFIAGIIIWAWRFIIATKFSTLPATPSASATEASLPLCARSCRAAVRPRSASSWCR